MEEGSEGGAAMKVKEQEQKEEENRWHARYLQEVERTVQERGWREEGRQEADGWQIFSAAQGEVGDAAG